MIGAPVAHTYTAHTYRVLERSFHACHRYHHHRHHCDAILATGTGKVDGGDGIDVESHAC